MYFFYFSCLWALCNFCFASNFCLVCSKSRMSISINRPQIWSRDSFRNFSFFAFRFSHLVFRFSYSLSSCRNVTNNFCNYTFGNLWTNFRQSQKYNLKQLLTLFLLLPESFFCFLLLLLVFLGCIFILMAQSLLSGVDSNKYHVHFSISVISQFMAHP